MESPNRKGIKDREGSTVLRSFSWYLKIFLISYWYWRCDGAYNKKSNPITMGKVDR
jgi:hypothetical protein